MRTTTGSRFGWMTLGILSLLSTSAGCIETEPFSLIKTGYNADCERVAILWEEQSDGTLASREILCTNVFADTNADPELVKACEWDGLGECTAGVDGGADADATGTDVADVDDTGGTDAGTDDGGGPDINVDTGVDTGTDAASDTVDGGVSDADAVGDAESDAQDTSDTAGDGQGGDTQGDGVVAGDGQGETMDAQGETTDAGADAPVNTPPVLTLPPDWLGADWTPSSDGYDDEPTYQVVALTGQELALTITATDADASDQLTISVSEHTGWGSLGPDKVGFTQNFPHTGTPGMSLATVSLEGTAGTSTGLAVLRVEVTDGNGGSDVAFLEIIVNDPPVLQAPVGVTLMSIDSSAEPEGFSAVVNNGDDMSFSITATDVYEEDVSITVTQDPSSELSAEEIGFVESLPYSTGGPSPHTLNMTGAAGESGTTRLVLTATDSFGAVAVNYLDVRVNGPPAFDAPVFGEADAKVYEDDPDYTVVIPLGGDLAMSFTAQDPNSDDALDISTEVKSESTVTGVEAGFVEEIPGEHQGAVPHTYSLTGTAAKPGIFSMNVIVTDNAGATDLITVKVIIRAQGADINGDGYADMIFGSCPFTTGDGYASVVFGSATPANSYDLSSAADVRINGDGGFGRRVAAGDINGDSFDDLIVVAPEYAYESAGDGAIFIWYGSPTLSPTSVESADVTLGGLGKVTGPLAVGDINGDGFDDIVISSFVLPASGNSAVRVIFGGSLSNGHMDNGPGALVQGDSDDWGRVVRVADVNGDGKGDLVVVGTGATQEAFRVYSGDTLSGTVDLGSHVAAVTDQLTDGLATGDFNGDGSGDVVSGQAEKTLLYFGSGAFSGGVTATSVPALITDSNTQAKPSTPSKLAGDINGDGIHDLMVFGFLSSTVDHLFLKFGWGTTPTSDVLVSSAEAWVPACDLLGCPAIAPQMAGVGDVNGDGFADWAFSDAGLILVHAGADSLSGALSKTPAMITISEDGADNPIICHLPEFRTW